VLFESGLTAAAVPTSWAIAGTAESAVLASSKARLPVIRGFIRDGIRNLQKLIVGPIVTGEILDRVPRDIRI
jgi:hypothetical protein